MIQRLLLLSLAIRAASAATIEFMTLPGNEQYGTYNGYVGATVDGIYNQPLICDDFDHTTYVPSGPLMYTESMLVPFTSVDTRFGNLQDYEEAAFLLAGLNQNPGSTADYQYALWRLFTPSVELPDSNAQALLNTAAASVAAGGSTATALYGRLLIFTPASGYTSNQEFLQLLPTGVQTTANPPVPEPSGVAMMGVGIALIGASVGLKARRRQKQQP